MKNSMRSIAVAACATVFCGSSAVAADMVSNVVSSVSFSAYADIESAYYARGAIVDKRPFSAQFAAASVAVCDGVRIGGYAWSVSSLSQSGQSAKRRYAYNEADYNLFASYDYELAEDWVLNSRLALQWVTLRGYEPRADTIFEWQAAQSLENPYVTPYYLLRRAYDQSQWCYWKVGLRRTLALADTLSFTVDAFGDLGDDRHFASQYGPRPGGGSYGHGLMALNLVLRLDWSLTDNLGVYAFVHQFDIVSSAGRDAMDESKTPQSRSDLTIGGVGVKVDF